MGRKHSAGLRLRGGVWHIEKQIRGRKICESTGTGRLEEAESIFARRREEFRQAMIFGVRPRRVFREAATKYLNENMHLASIGDIARHLRQLDPFIGGLVLESLHLGALQPFIEHRQHAGVKVKSINLALGVVRRILNLSARLWRDEHGLTWLENAPLIQLLPDSTAREPYPLDWEEQRRLFQALPDHLARMCLFKLNTGCREQEVCRLRWEWEVQVPELKSSVFIIPGARVKNREDRLVVLNRVARSVIEEAWGKHPEYVFTYRGHPVQSINNTGWQCARRSVGLTQVRVHDLKHTYGRRLRAAGVPLETRRALLGHKNGDITTHYSAPELQELIDAAERVCHEEFGKTSAMTLLKKKRSTDRAVNRLM